MEDQLRAKCLKAARQLSDENVHVLQYIYRINIPSNCDTTVSKALYVFERLEEDGRLRPDNDSLINLLNDLPRCDIVSQLFDGTTLAPPKSNMFPTKDQKKPIKTSRRSTSKLRHRHHRSRGYTGTKNPYLDPKQRLISFFFQAQ